MAELKSNGELRKQGICPHDRKHCHRAARCALSKSDSCAVNNTGLVEKCSPVMCRRKFGACKWQCMRRGGLM